MRRKSVAALCFILAMGWSGAVHADLVTNGGFEDNSGTPGNPIPGWTVTGDGVGLDSTFPNTGSNDVFFSTPSADPSLGTLSQTVATTPGQAYVLSFALMDEAGSFADVFTESFGGQTQTITGDNAAYTYTEESVTIAGSDITAGMTALSFSGVNDNAAWNLDDVSLVPVAVPEPRGVAMFGLALLAVAVFLRRAD